MERQRLSQGTSIHKDAVMSAVTEKEKTKKDDVTLVHTRMHV